MCSNVLKCCQLVRMYKYIVIYTHSYYLLNYNLFHVVCFVYDLQVEKRKKALVARCDAKKEKIQKVRLISLLHRICVIV